MIYFNTPDGNKWKMTFKYAEETTPSHKDGKCFLTPTRRTYCTLVRLRDGWCVKDYADCSPLDQFRKEVGRKIALTRALEVFEDVSSRRSAWEAYFNR